MTVRRDQEVSVTAEVSLTEDETNEIAAAFPPAIKGKGQMANYGGASSCEPCTTTASANGRLASKSSALQAVIPCIRWPVR